MFSMRSLEELVPTSKVKKAICEAKVSRFGRPQCMYIYKTDAIGHRITSRSPKQRIENTWESTEFEGNNQM